MVKNVASANETVRRCIANRVRAEALTSLLEVSFEGPVIARYAL